MKNAIFLTFRILLGLVILFKILNWFLKFDSETNQFLNTAMFCLIGIAYLVMGYVWDKKILKVLITACGLFLIIMNFSKKNAVIVFIYLLNPLLTRY